MGSITEKFLDDGLAVYVARIQIKANGKWVHRESRTFDKKKTGENWLKRRTKEINTIGVSNAKKQTLADAIDRYIAEDKGAIGRTKTQVLRSIKEYDIADMHCAKIESSDLVDLARELAITRTPATVSNYMSHLRAIFVIAKPAWKMPLEIEAMKSAMVVCQKLNLTGKAMKRERRPTLPELDQLLLHFQRKSAGIPMVQIVIFALFSSRRQEEITTIKWDDLEGDRVMVRDMKHPGEKIGNNIWVNLPQPALNIIRSRTRTADEIFPFNPRSISSSFTNACKCLAIEDLRFHDLRHEGVSRLFEMGLTIPQVSAVSGHRSWGSLQRYTHIRTKGDKYENWPWISE